MNRRTFLLSTAAIAAAPLSPLPFNGRFVHVDVVATIAPLPHLYSYNFGDIVTVFDLPSPLLGTFEVQYFQPTNKGFTSPRH